MCLISDKIKFCTCTSQSVEKLKHYWILYRLNTEEKEEMYMGIPMMPTDFTDVNFEENQKNIGVRLNNSEAFDFDVKFEENDLIEVVLNNNSPLGNYYMYAFEYLNDKWKPVECDPFRIMNAFDEEQSGKIKNALKRTKNK